VPIHEKDDPPALVELCIAANFIEVLLAREGHGHPVGINYLEKIQLPHLPSLYGAVLAGVDYVLMGAGIPVRIPGVLDRFVNHEPATYPLTLAGGQERDQVSLSFDPRAFVPLDLPPLRRPVFLAIVSTHVLAQTLAKRANGSVDGFVVEGPAAGGHNAPPRGKLQLNDTGEPIYGARDLADLERLRAIGRPFRHHHLGRRPARPGAVHDARVDPLHRGGCDRRDSWLRPDSLRRLEVRSLVPGTRPAAW